MNFIGYQVTQYLSTGFSDHTEVDYQKIAGLGFNVVRLPISWQHIEPIEGYYNESYFTEFIDRDIEWAERHGIYIIIDLAHWGWSPYFEYTGRNPYGFPSWLFDGGYPNSEEGKLQSISDFWLGKSPNGVEPTLENPSMQDRMIEVWKYLAERYKNNPTVLGYDLFNEPPQGSLGVDSASNYLYSFIERLIGEIRNVDSNHIFIYEPILGRWDYAPRFLDTPNTIFSIHIYPHHNDATKLGYSGDITVLESQLLGYLEHPQSNPSKNWNIPILVGEFGVSTSPFYSNKVLWVNDMADLYTKYNIQWTYWDYGLNSGNKWSVVNPDRTEVKEKAEALDKPYPRLSSIAPVEFSFDRDTKLFEVVFNGVGNVETEIRVPYRYYPDGFSVNCNSSQWTKNWDEPNRILTVNASLQSTVQITINPGPSQGNALIIGKVTNTETGVAVTGATVAANGYQATIGAGGTYLLEVALGTYSLTVSANGYKGKTQTLDASEEETYTVDFALTPLSPDQPSQAIPRNAIIIGGVAAIIAVAATVALLARRKRAKSVHR